MEAALTWKSPKTGHHLISFLGFANYYREFIKGYADKVSASKSEHKSASEAPEIQAIPYIQQPTPVIDLTASSSTSGNQVAEVPISIQSKSPSPTKDKILSCPDLIPIYSDDQSLDPKLQECSSSNLAASGCIWFSFRARRG